MPERRDFDVSDSEISARNSNKILIDRNTARISSLEQELKECRKQRWKATDKCPLHLVYKTAISCLIQEVLSVEMI